MIPATEVTTRKAASRVHPAWCGLLLAFGVLLCSAALASEQPGKVLKIGYVEFAPFQYEDRNGKPAGSLVELTRQVAKEAGYGVDFVPIPVGRVYVYLRNGRIDAWMGLTDVPSLKGAVTETDASPLSIELRAWYLDPVPAFQSLNDLRGKTVIVIAGYTYGGQLEAIENLGQVRIYEAPNHQAALQMLAKGRGDYLLDYRQPIEEILAESPLAGLNSTSLNERNAAWVFSLKRPDTEEAKVAFDSAYLRLAWRNELPAFARRPDAVIQPALVKATRGDESASTN